MDMIDEFKIAVAQTTVGTVGAKIATPIACAIQGAGGIAGFSKRAANLTKDRAKTFLSFTVDKPANMFFDNFHNHLIKEGPPQS